MFNGRRVFAIGLFVCLLSGSSAILADVLELTAVKDTSLFEEDDALSNGAGEHFFAGNNDAAETRRGLVGFDLSSIPAGSTINSVTLTLSMSRTKASSIPVTLHRVLNAWGEGSSNAPGQEGAGTSAELDDATWRYRFYDPGDVPGSLQWSSLGGDFVAGASATTSVGNNGFYNWSSGAMAVDVQGWLDSPPTNFGWIVRGGETGQKKAKRFDSRQNSDSGKRPKLTVDFDPPAGACCVPGQGCSELTPGDCTTQGGTFQGNGTDCSPDPCVDPIGGCCFGDGSCSELSAASCSGSGGAYEGNGSTCTPNPCPQPVGACCAVEAPWSCTEITEDDCVNANGVYQGDAEQCSLIECPVVLDPFVDALPIPPVAQPVAGAVGGAATYHVVMQEFQQQLHGDLPATTLWGYGTRPDLFDPAATYSTYLGPTILARTGDPVTVRYFNDLRDTSLGGSPPPLRTTHYLNVDTCAHGADDQSPRTVVHLHGGHVEPHSDGYPEDTFLPGQQSSTDYVYPNQQQAATLWFHDHGLGITRLNVYMGMAAAYLITDDVEQSLNLPSGEFEAPLIIQDRTFNPDGSLKYPESWQEANFGDKLLVNGKVWPYLEVKQGKYRFRVLNGCNARRLTLSLERQDQPSQVPFHQIGTDGGLLPGPVTLNQLTLGPAERADVIVDFQQLPAGTEVILTNSAVVPPPGVIPNVMKFIVQAQTGDTDAVPASLSPIEVLDPADAVRTREFLLRKGDDACTGQAWVIKSRNENGVEVGERWDDLTDYPQLGTTEIWEFINPTVIPHPMHMHLVFFQILNRQAFELVDDQVVLIGPPIPPGPEEAGWKDTARAEPGHILRVIARFEDYAGQYAYHCHILEHEDHEMMRQFTTIGPVDLRMTDTSIDWEALPGATGYDLVRGSLDTLIASDGDFQQSTQTCLVDGLLTLTRSHQLDVPPPGEGYFYLSRIRDVIGKGTYDSGHRSQVDMRDAEVAASGQDCGN